MTPPTITVLIPTYRRPKDLARCLNALGLQQHAPDEVLVVVRDSDTDTWNFLSQFNTNSLPLKILTVNTPGVIAAMNIGLTAAQGDIISLTDDDAAPHSNWLKHIHQYFAQDESIGGVGGRDLMYFDGIELIEGQKDIVGRLQWFGRTIGNHHLGYGECRTVDILKGVNMSFRRQAVGRMRFDERMKGSGAQVHFEIAFCLALKRAGWKLIYDPKIAVDHYQARRFDEDQRNHFNELAFSNAVHNETLALLEHFSKWQCCAFVIWSTIIGTRKAFGFIQWLRFFPHEKKLATQKWKASIRGRWQGWLTWRNTQHNHSAWTKAKSTHQA